MGARGMEAGASRLVRSSAVLWCMAALAVPAVGQRAIVASAPITRVAGPVIQVVALPGDRIQGDRFEAIGGASITRAGDIAFVATTVHLNESRLGLFAWFKGAVEPLAREGDSTGEGPLLVMDEFGDWAWNEGPRAVFIGAADANKNGVYDPGIDPQFLFRATRGRLTRLLRMGDRLDGGTLLAIRSFRLNQFGQVAFQARIDRNGDGVYTPGIDTAGIYLLKEGRIERLIREGDEVGDGRLRNLDTDQALEWQLNDRAEVVVHAGLDRIGDAAVDADALFLLTPAGNRQVVRTGLQTSLGTFRQLGSGSLNDSGDVVFPGAFSSAPEAQFGIFRFRLSSRPEPLEQLVQPGDVGPDRTEIADILPAAAVNDQAFVAFCGFYRQNAFAIAGAITNPAACFLLAPDFLYEVIRQGDLTPWGRADLIQALLLNDRTQSAVQMTVETFPFEEFNGYDGASTIFFWENGIRIAVVGPADRIPGGRVGFDTTLYGLSENGWLPFGATVTDDGTTGQAAGTTRRGLFAARVSN